MGNELIPFNPIVPEIVDEQGQSVEGPEMERVIKLMTGVAQNAQLARIRKALERRQTQGKKFTTTLIATDQVQWLDLLESNPYTPLATVRFFNIGPSQAYIAINDNYDFTPVWINAEFPLDYTEADERIHYIAYKCDPGGSARIQLLATY